MLFRRPELEKDNPIAPQPYIGLRRRLALARASASREFTEENDLETTLQDLTLAASRYVDSLQKRKKTEKHLKILQDAIAQAERVLDEPESKSACF
ncbi:MAG: hypothetical protein CV088_05560 [Nitrospira sp. LK70]|nr:hypothetical protein [Nitrospira sp. LK70]